MDINKLAQTLHPLERAILPFLENNITLKSIVKSSKLEEVQVMRALQWLENKDIIKTTKSSQEIINLDKNGHNYLSNGLPEKRFLRALEKTDFLKEIEKLANLAKEELNICIGLLKTKNLISIHENFKIKITTFGKGYLKNHETEEFLKSLPILKSSLNQEQEKVYNELKRRKQIIKTGLEKTLTIHLMDLGLKLKNVKIDSNTIDQLTSSLIKNSSWKNKPFRRYDVKINVPRIYPGKRHFVNEAKLRAKQIWLDLGFKEMTGPIINPCFWNFDALFVPQDHPAREMQDTFFVKGTDNLPDKTLVNKVKKIQESSWKYSWSEKEAKRLVLRTHTTVLSARTLAALKKSDLPAKFFSVGRNYRNEAIDWSHLFEFNQTDGIVIDPNANFRHLLGYLKEFFKKMGYEKIRFRPGHFPYTEPSLEIDVYVPERKKWMELGGAGIFRPEMVIPLLGEDIPVLAWGPGFDRIVTQYYQIKDIRDLYKNDIKQLKEMKTWI